LKTWNLVVTFKLFNECKSHVKGAASIKIDGRGSVFLYDSLGSVPERIELRSLQSFSIESCSGLSPAMTALA